MFGRLPCFSTFMWRAQKLLLNLNYGRLRLRWWCVFRLINNFPFKNVHTPFSLWIWLSSTSSAVHSTYAVQMRNDKNDEWLWYRSLHTFSSSQRYFWKQVVDDVSLRRMPFSPRFNIRIRFFPSAFWFDLFWCIRTGRVRKTISFNSACNARTFWNVFPFFYAEIVVNLWHICQYDSTTHYSIRQCHRSGVIRPISILIYMTSISRARTKPYFMKNVCYRQQNDRTMSPFQTLNFFI